MHIRIHVRFSPKLLVRTLVLATVLSSGAAHFALSSPGGEMLNQARSIDLLSLAVWHEARGESAEGKRLVASAILERVRDERWPDTVEGVLAQSSQFFGLDFSRKPEDGAADWAECMDAAWQALTTRPSVAANHFHAVGVHPSWHDPTKVVKRVGGHVFLRL
ncbi:MAG: cell wall hydrolase [Bryobacterales bacterium]|nr:cell wall hydrolase [Acidobacteriota bacterium]MCB9385726.1 cell wall hydrolase [Bryobacterales bacterium]